MSSTTNPGERSAADIEREVEQTRARLTGTVEQLKERVSPGQMTEQAMDWLRGSGGREFVGNLGTAVRDNPVPVLLIAAGIGWLAFGGRSSASTSRYTAAPSLREPAAYPGESYPAETYVGSSQSGPLTYGADDGGYQYGDAGTGSSLGQRAGEAASGLRERAGDLAGRAGETAANLRDQAGQLAGRAGETASDAWDSVTGAASSAGRDIADRANRAWSSASGTASHLAQRGGDLGNQAGQRIAGLAETQPLLLGAVGLAIGAALGAILPGSEAEDRLMGESRDRVADRVQELAGDAYQQARGAAGEHLGKAQEALGEVYSHARDRMAESGVSAQGGAQALGEVARELRETVERTAQDAAGAARAATDRPAGPSTGTGPV